MAEDVNLKLMDEAAGKELADQLKALVENKISGGEASGDSTAGVNNVTSVSDIPIDKRMILAEILESDSFSLSEVPTAGKEVHVVVKNTSAGGIVVTLPNNGGYICLVDSALSIDADSYAEINVISDGENMYIRAL